MSSDIFRFKNFSVRQSSSAMKVGTDGVLLGAWATSQCSEELPHKILDIGTGTGVIALMAAEVCPFATVTAVEIEPKAAQEAQYNFLSSKWSDRLTVENRPFQEFCKNEIHPNYFDIIITNPPYFINSLKNETASKTAARHTLLLPYEDLAEGTEKILSKNGLFFAILPYEQANIFIAIAALRGLYLRKRVDVQGSYTTATKRVLLKFTKEKGDTASSSLVIEKSRGEYTEKYKELTSRFYLKF